MSATPQVTQMQQHVQFKPAFSTACTIEQAEAVIISGILLNRLGRFTMPGLQLILRNSVQINRATLAS